MSWESREAKILIHLRDSSRDSYDSDRASTLEKTRAEKSYQTPKDSGKASALELRGGGIYRAMGELHRLGRGDNSQGGVGWPSHLVGQPMSLASTNFLHRHSVTSHP
jgi:hypothetical protein